MVITAKDALSKAESVAQVLIDCGCDSAHVNHTINCPGDRNVMWVSIDVTVNGDTRQAFSVTGYTREVFKALDNFRLGVQFAEGVKTLQSVQKAMKF